MKKAVWILVLCALHTGASAQMRKLRPEEVTYLNSINAAVYESVPRAHKDWKVVADGQRTDARKIWCDGPLYGKDCTGDCPSSLGVGDPYSLSYSADYYMSDNDKGSTLSTSMSMIKDFTNGAQLAASQKFAAKTTMRINVLYNVPVEMSFAYCANTPMETLQLPVPAALAVIGKRTEACPIQEDGRTSMKGDYYDRALIVLGKTATKKGSEKTSDGLTTVKYLPGFDKAKLSKPMTQNIVIEIKGNAEDIKELVKQIDWAKLNSMMNK